MEKKSTLTVKKQGKLLVLPVKHFVFGIQKIKSVLSELHPDKEDIISKTYKTLEVAYLLFVNKKKSVTLEFLPKNKLTTLDDKKIFSSPNFLLTTWLQTLARELIGREKDFKPFWNKSCEEMSQKLWLPIETDSADLPLNFLSQSFQNATSNSWFSIKKMKNPKTTNLPMTFSPSYMSIPVERWDVGVTKQKEILRTKKIRLQLTKDQRMLLKKWMGTRRYVYNKCLDKIKNGQEKINMKNLRNKYVTATSRKGIKNQQVQEWETKTPKDIRAGAIQDLVANYKSAFSNLKNNNIFGFSMGFCKKKSTPSIKIPLSGFSLDGKKEKIQRTEEELKKAKKKSKKDATISKERTRITVTKKEGGFYLFPEFMKEKIKVKKRNLRKPFIIDTDSRISFQNGVWYLSASYKTKTSYPETNGNFCALDPGVRTFQTVYAEDSVTKFETKTETLKKLLCKLDSLQASRMKKLVKPARTRELEKIKRRQLDNKINDLHHKTANELTKNYDTIFLPKFETQDIVRKSKNRHLNRTILLLKHYTFQKRLEAKCEVRKRNFVLVTEEFTSKTCGNCGNINNNLGSASIFNCDNCRVKIDRDVNGARNVFIKSMN